MLRRDVDRDQLHRVFRDDRDLGFIADRDPVTRFCQNPIDRHGTSDRDQLQLASRCQSQPRRFTRPQRTRENSGIGVQSQRARPRIHRAAPLAKTDNPLPARGKLRALHPGLTPWRSGSIQI